MNDDKPHDGRPFPWGLRPNGEERPAAPEPLDLGHLFATPVPYMDVETAAFEFRPQSALSAGVDTTPVSAEPIDQPAESYEDLATEAFPFQPPEPPQPSLQPQPFEPAAPADPAPTEPYTPHPPAMDSALDGVGAAVAQPVALPAPAGEGAPTSALDALFNEREFQEYTDESPVAVFVPRPADRENPPSAAVVAPRPVRPPKAPKAPKPSKQLAAAPPRSPSAPVQRHQRVLGWVAGGLVAALVLVGLFYLGTQLPGAEPGSGPVTQATPASTPTPAETEAPVEAVAPVVPVAASIGPVAPGVHAWNGLLGTECLEPFASAWEEQYTVVDCAAAHAGQLVYRGRFEESALDPYPGVDGLQARMNLLCATPTNINYAAASAYNDIMVSASFAGTPEAWAAGNRDYYCFVSRSSGQPFAGSISTPPQPLVVIPVVAAPEP